MVKNDYLGQIKWEQMVFLGNPEFGVELAPIDFVKFAEACGASGVRIDDPKQCGAQLESALGTPGPVLIEAVVDPLEAPLPARLTIEQARQFALVAPARPARSGGDRDQCHRREGPGAGVMTVDPQERAETAKQRKRKERVLTHSSASAVKSITDAVAAKNGEPFFLCNPDGQIPLDGRHGLGFFHHDMRYLSGYDLRLGGRQPTPLIATATAGTAVELELTNDAFAVDGQTIPKEGLDLHWERAVERDPPALRERLTICNLGRSPVRLPLAIRIRADFRDVFVIRGMLGSPAGRRSAPQWDHDRLLFARQGGDGVRRELQVSFTPPPAMRQDRGASYDVRLGAGEKATIEIRHVVHEEVEAGAEPIERGENSAAPAHPARAATVDVRRWIGGSFRTQIRTDSLLLSQVLELSLADLELLRGELGGMSYYEAGLPWFATLFGRDSIMAALQTLAYDPRVAEETLRLLASLQGSRFDSWHDEEPGKILHEIRVGELARLNAIPHTPYYGSVDATPLFLILLERHAAWTGSLDCFRELGDNVSRALEWIDHNESNHDGYVAYDSSTQNGLVNQGWKDSGNAIVSADGRLATPPIALAEVQGYVYRARLATASLYEHAGDTARAAELRHAAEDLRVRFERDFWSEESGCYALALERGGRRCDVVTSNAGQVLWSGIASSERARRVVDRLMAPDMFAGWGIRTLSSEAVAFNPIGYHLGTVWPHDNGVIAEGFQRYAFHDEASRVFAGLVEAAMDFKHQRLPECFAGYDRKEFGIPVRYPIACHPQAWAAGSIPHLLETSLGLFPDAFEGRLGIVRASLPSFVSSVEMKGLAVGGGRAHLRFERDADGATSVEVLAVEGRLDVEVEGDSPAGRHAPPSQPVAAGAAA